VFSLLKEAENFSERWSHAILIMSEKNRPAGSWQSKTIPRCDVFAISSAFYSDTCRFPRNVHFSRQRIWPSPICRQDTKFKVPLLKFKISVYNIMTTETILGSNYARGKSVSRELAMQILFQESTKRKQFSSRTWPDPIRRVEFRLVLSNYMHHYDSRWG